MKSIAGLVGIYEKGLPEFATWEETFTLAASSGYDFFEMSIDESVDRISRLEWSEVDRAKVRRASESAGVIVGALTLSAHRAYPMGSAEPERRQRSLELARQAVDLAADVDAPLVQLAGYFTFYENDHMDARSLFLAGLAKTAEHAQERGVRLALENVDGNNLVNLGQAMSLIHDSDTGATAGLYVDVGNLVANGYDAIDQLRQAWPMVEAIQLKDARPGQFRRVSFGEGEVPWLEVFNLLRDKKYDGPLSVEMWNDTGDSDLAREALEWLGSHGLAAEKTSDGCES